jgi:F420-dependent hydroxymycolic acid dehydrogenase
MIVDIASSIAARVSPSRRQLLKSTPALMAAAGVGAISSPASAQQMFGSSQPQTQTAMPAPELHGKNIVGFMLAHEQFPVPELVELGTDASQAGFGALATSDHLQPWQSNEGHAGQAWITLSSVGSRAPSSWIGTTVTCPTVRYNPAVVAEAFASLSLLYPGRVFLGVGSGEALNEEAAIGGWPRWPERWERLIEAISIIRALWSGPEHPSV